MYQTWCTYYGLLYSQIISICFASALEARYTYPCATFLCLILLTIRLPSPAGPTSSRGHEVLLPRRLAGFARGHSLAIPATSAGVSGRVLECRQGLSPSRLRLARPARNPELRIPSQPTPGAPVHPGLWHHHGISAGFRAWTHAVFLGWSGECGGSRPGVGCKAIQQVKPRCLQRGFTYQGGAPMRPALQNPVLSSKLAQLSRPIQFSRL